MDAVDFAHPSAHQDDGKAGRAGTSRPIGMACRGKQKFMAAQSTGPGSRQPTINDVAAAAGVSKKTVSRVINNSPLSVARKLT